jgi:hypothetical protein
MHLSADRVHLESLVSVIGPELRGHGYGYRSSRSSTEPKHWPFKLVAPPEVSIVLGALL